ncbi:MAG TPA: Stp1/IreP family PP2C-type Ser/Thr phosphatase [Methylomusa anaerophila]|uniref:Serine/threonine phosphatase stp n=1 Tax=Methylomusa anaerophila TaxID=1930071 RepID=A0A348APN7_9FIRM|nr:Stp1/IreP family PP2C-type Ser/Thr phosphatase [Methylomusa anaerophila]BBB93035.1 serine/threonine phosphatase stp [Methylomusa anaerophila]HML87131.1 Stp1/IreP family PP2C-type Ser/Thr phosphatase [Methylomusa anaerophila]
MLAYAGTDIGLLRKTNEDSYIYSPPHLFVVADGMGGHVAGEIASNLGANTINEYIKKCSNISEWEQVLLSAIAHANMMIYQMAQCKIECSGMGTTITSIYIDNKDVYWGHVGDSRLYFIRNNRLQQITTDHSLVWELVQSGSITNEEAQVHPHRNILTRAVGTSEEIRIDTGKLEWRQGDSLLLCTDGLTNMVSENTIQETINMHPADAEAVVNALIQRANLSGGHDNITVIYIYYEK